MRLIAIVLSVCSLLIQPGCVSPDTASHPYATPSARDRNSLLAQELTQQAAEILSDDPDRAEVLLRRALVADLFFGPAHNNLGVIHLTRGDLFEAAAEFEWARKLMPGHPDPRVNLALTFERAGRFDEAAQAYRVALESYPEYLPALQGLARLQIRNGRPDGATISMLEAIALRGESEAWREWARERLAAMNN